MTRDHEGALDCSAHATRAPTRMATHGIGSTFQICTCVACLSLLLRLLSGSAPLPSSTDGTLHVGAQVAVRCASNGRYLEVGDNGWLFASAFAHNRHAARFQVEAIAPETLRSLVATREFGERTGSVAHNWDMRPQSAGSSGASSAGDDAGDASSEDEERARRRLAHAIQRGVSGWVALRSDYAGGYVEALGRGEDNEYVVRVAPEGKLSYRSLFLLGDEAIWSHGVGGYLNWRQPTSSEPKQHVRAHGNVEPWGPLRTLTSSARFRVVAPPPVVDVLGGLACPVDVPPFDWALLLDAARAGACDSSGLPALRTAATALEALHGTLGDALGSELADLAGAYRDILLDQEWRGILDLQLAPCARAGGGGGGDFSWIDEASGELVVDGGRCPRAAFSEVPLRPMPDEVLPLEMRRLSDSPAGGAATDGDASASGAPAATAAAAAPPELRAALEGEAAFVLCDHVDSLSSSSSDGELDPSTDLSAADFSAEGEGGAEEGEEGVHDDGAPREQQLLFRVSRRTTLHGGKTDGAGDGSSSSSPGSSAAAEGAAADAAADAAVADAAAADAFAASEGAVVLPFNRSGAASTNEPNSQEANAAREAARKEAASAEADAAAEVAEAQRRAVSAQLSVVMLMLDATSRAHLRRMLPRSLALLRALASSGAATLYEFPFYSIVGFNSVRVLPRSRALSLSSPCPAAPARGSPPAARLRSRAPPAARARAWPQVPNMVPMLTGSDADQLINTPPVGSYGTSGYFGVEGASDFGGGGGSSSTAGGGASGGGGGSAGPPQAVWKGFAARGYATFLLEELHDGCSDLTGAGVPSSVSKLLYSRYGADGMPHHNAWQIFCQPELRPCCSDPQSFLRPGRRQCVGGKELPALLLDYVRQLLRRCASGAAPTHTPGAARPLARSGSGSAPPVPVTGRSWQGGRRPPCSLRSGHHRSASRHAARALQVRRRGHAAHGAAQSDVGARALHDAPRRARRGAPRLPARHRGAPAPRHRALPPLRPRHPRHLVQPLRRRPGRAPRARPLPAAPRRLCARPPRRRRGAAPQPAPPRHRVRPPRDAAPPRRVARHAAPRRRGHLAARRPARRPHLRGGARARRVVPRVRRRALRGGGGGGVSSC